MGLPYYTMWLPYYTMCILYLVMDMPNMTIIFCYHLLIIIFLDWFIVKILYIEFDILFKNPLRKSII